MPMPQSKTRQFMHQANSYFWIILGAFLFSLSLQVFLVPNQLIDGGIVGVALILARLYESTYFSYFLILLNIPFVYLAYRFIRKSFVIHMLIAIGFLALWSRLLHDLPAFTGDSLEIIIFGGAILGVGAGLIIRYGACLDGTEILAILINQKKGFTVGQVVLVFNIFIFGAYGWIFQDWHIALQSLMTCVVAMKMIDLVIVGLDEVKSALIISSHPKQLSQAIMSELGLGLTIIHGKGGFSGEPRELLFVVLERLDLSDLKEIVLREDPSAFIAIENLHEVVQGTHAYLPYRKKKGARARKT